MFNVTATPRQCHSESLTALRTQHLGRNSGSASGRHASLLRQAQGRLRQAQNKFQLASRVGKTEIIEVERKEVGRSLSLVSIYFSPGFRVTACGLARNDELPRVADLG
jgi:hypothetical protein